MASARPNRTVVLSGVPPISQENLCALLQDYGQIDVRHQGSFGAASTTWHVSFESVEYAQAFLEGSFDDFVVYGVRVALDYLARDSREVDRRDGRRNGRSGEDEKRDRRERDGERERDRERDRDRDRGRESGRDRERERERDRGEREQRERDRGGDRYKDRERRRDNDDRDRRREGKEWHDLDRESERDLRERKRPAEDWLCADCRAVNFARRSECFQCQAAKPRNAQTVPTSDPRAASSANSEPDVPVLMVKLLKETTTEAQIAEAFSTCGGVREVRATTPREHHRDTENPNTAAIQMGARRSSQTRPNHTAQRVRAGGQSHLRSALDPAGQLCRTNPVPVS